MVNKPAAFRGHLWGVVYRLHPLACCKWDVQEESDSPCRHDFRSWATQDMVKLHTMDDMMIQHWCACVCVWVCVCGGFHCFWFYILFGTLVKVPFKCLSALSLTIVCSKGLSIQMLAAAMANVFSTVRRLFGARHCRIVWGLASTVPKHREHTHWRLLR